MLSVKKKWTTSCEKGAAQVFPRTQGEIQGFFDLWESFYGKEVRVSRQKGDSQYGIFVRLG